MNNTGTKYVRIMKQTAFWREKKGEYILCLKYFLILLLVFPEFLEFSRCQEPNTLELWKKVHFEDKKRRVYTMFKIFSTYICWIENVLQCSWFQYLWQFCRSILITDMEAALFVPISASFKTWKAWCHWKRPLFSK